MKFEYQDKIDSYVLGDMTADERLAFEHEVHNNQELREQLEYTQQIKTLITSRQEKMTLLKHWEEEWKMEDEQIAATQYKPTGTDDFCPAPAYHTTFHKRSKKLLYWISGIAAVFVIGFFIDITMFISGGSSGGVGTSRNPTNEVFEENMNAMPDYKVDTMLHHRLDSIKESHK